MGGKGLFRSGKPARDFRVPYFHFREPARHACLPFRPSGKPWIGRCNRPAGDSTGSRQLGEPGRIRSLPNAPSGTGFSLALIGAWAEALLELGVALPGPLGRKKKVRFRRNPSPPHRWKRESRRDETEKPRPRRSPWLWRCQSFSHSIRGGVHVNLLHTDVVSLSNQRGGRSSVVEELSVHPRRLGALPMLRKMNIRLIGITNSSRFACTQIIEPNRFTVTVELNTHFMAFFGV